MNRAELIVVTGRSGSGKTTVLRALEDAGLTCVDNLPAALLAPLMDHYDHHGDATRRIAVAMDVRLSEEEGDAVARGIQSVVDTGRPTRVLYLDAKDSVLVSRHKETRRRHPLMMGGPTGVAATLTDALRMERAWLAPFMAMATETIDSTAMNVHELKGRVQAMIDGGRAAMTVHLLSFGFRRGLPLDADYAFDIRFLKNPYFDLSLRSKTGLDDAVRDFVLEQPATKRMIDHLIGLFNDVLPQAEAEGKTSVTIAIGCTGGQHRSVALVEALGRHLVSAGRHPYISHRDIPR